MSSRYVEKNMFVKWISIHVPHVDVTQENLVEKFSNGILLLDLFEVLTKSHSSIKVPKTANKLQVIGFITEVLRLFEGCDLRLTISADNIYEGDETMILGLIWTLILKFHVNQKKEILLWIREIFPKEEILNFDSNWRNGDLFCALVQQLANNQDPLPNDALSRLQYAFQISESELQIPAILSAEDIVAGYFDERFCLTYLSLFYQRYRNRFQAKSDSPERDNQKIADNCADLLRDRILELEKLVVQKDKRIEELERENSNQRTMLEKSELEIHQIVRSIGSLTGQLTEQTEANEDLQKQIHELQLKIPFMNQKVSNLVPPPTGNAVTLMMLDVPQAEEHWDKHPNSMAIGLQSLQQIARGIVKGKKGFEVEIINERITFSFSSVEEAVSSAVDIQQSLVEMEWPKCFYEQREEIFRGINVSIALHTGTAAFIEGKYSGPAFKLVTRLISVCRGGEILTTQSTWNHCARDLVPENIYKAELGKYDVQELKAPIHILQLFPENLAERGSKYGEFMFLTPDERKQVELEEKLAALENDVAMLLLKLVATEKEANQTRDRALELSAWFKEHRGEENNTEGKQLSEFMAEVASLVRESEGMEIALKVTKKELSGAKKYMNRMNDKLREISARNTILTNQLAKYESEHVVFLQYIQELEAKAEKGEIKSKETVLQKLLRRPSRKKIKNSNSEKTLSAPLETVDDGEFRAKKTSKRKRMQKSKSISFTKKGLTKLE